MLNIKLKRPCVILKTVAIGALLGPEERQGILSFISNVSVVSHHSPHIILVQLSNLQTSISTICGSSILLFLC